jgi:hypothetical protein
MIYKTPRGEQYSQGDKANIRATIGDMTMTKLIRKDKAAKKRLTQFVAMRERIVSVKRA